jgi:hypothetical protein
MKIYGIFHEDGSMDGGGGLMEDHFYVKRADAEVVRDQLYDSDLYERRIDFLNDSYLRNLLDDEIKNGQFGNLNPRYDVKEIEVKGDKHDVL